MLSVIIPHYRRKEDISLLLEDLKLQDLENFEVIVADDCSNDGSVEYLKARFPEAIVVVNPTNKGPSAARNLCISLAKGTNIVGIDSDVRVPDRSLLRNISLFFANNPSTTGIAARVLNSDGTEDDAPRWHHPLPIESYANSRFETCYFSGTAFAFRKEALVQADCFPEDLFQFYEEVELSLKIINNGGRIEHVPFLCVNHNPGDRPRRKEARFYFNMRNQILIAAHNYPIPAAIAFLAPRIVYYLIMTTKSLCIPIFFKSLRDAIKLLPRRLKTRRPLTREARLRIKKMKNPLISVTPAASQ